jgi:Uma2 family endonuclease
MASQEKPRYTPEEYLEIERTSEFKSEYIDGYIVAMSGASESHNLIVTNIVSELRGQLKGRNCRVYSNDMRIDLRERGLFAYPDVVVVCGDPELADEKRDNLRNPVVIIEVLSKSTERYDRGPKFMKYRRIDSLHEYLLVSQYDAVAEHYVRQPNDNWLMSEALGLDAVIRLGSIDSDIKLVEAYDKVRFSEED